MANNEAVEAVLKARYYQPGETDWLDICIRVCDYITGNGGEDKEEKYQRYLDVMKTKQFIPNSPVLFNFGTKHCQGSACFVLKVEDNIDSIYTTLHEAAKIFKSGGGVGFNFSRIRPAGSVVQGTNGVASGVVSFMGLFDTSTDVIKQGGKRRGAGIAILNIDHPEIEEFVDCKNEEGTLTNFNISVLITDAFIQAVETNSDWDLVFEGKVYKTIKARELYNKICQSIWTRAEPGVLFSDAINRDNPGTDVPIDTTNPCGEQPLQPYESCVLGSINLVAMLKDGKIDCELLNETVRTAVDFLNDVIDKNEYPLPEIEKTTKSFRKIGLGIMGFADVLIAYGLRYDNTPETLELIDNIMDTIKDTAGTRSRELASEFGAYPNYKPYRNGLPTRNATRLAIAPTGTISMIAGVSSGIEPNFAYVYDRKNSIGTYLQVHEQFEKDLRKERIASEGKTYEYIIKRMHETGTIQDIVLLSDEFKNKYVTATDVTPEAHIAIQAAFQKYVDSSISKTINCPEDTTVTEIEGYIMSAWKQGIKGLTFYRQNSRKDVVLNLAKQTEETFTPKVVGEIRGLAKEIAVTEIGSERPERLSGETFKFHSGCGKLYITVNHLGDKLYECFVCTSGKGGCAASSDSLGRTISLLLRNGVELDSITKQLRRVSCPAAIRSRCDGKSCSDIIGMALILAMQKVTPTPIPTRNPVEQLVTIDTPTCPECGAVVAMESGCVTCHSCGYSKCG